MQERQRPYIEQLLSLSGDLPVAKVPFTLEEIRGLAPLWALGEVLLKQLGLSLSGEEDGKG